MKISKPLPGEYAEFYAGYVSRVINDDVMAVLCDQPRELRAVLGDVNDHAAQTRPDEDEWSINEVVGHLNDGERIFAYRALRIARGDLTPLASFDQDAYILPGKFNARSLASLLDEFESIRSATLTLVNALDDDMLARVGTASQNAISARALVYIMAGHVHHHMESLKNVYLRR